ncbi:hypothetical protein HPB48_002904 [Haemaphysalis longicornis]|uniref:Uncharacterized protein n=1 Tax=Haemaphysalis longicornis TaxID=44386 RepID=A0A9J6FDJ1_HAELO|nr:hypothetical protein HPB48_002904 [Haemaphysalis longicornis]
MPNSRRPQSRQVITAHTRGVSMRSSLCGGVTDTVRIFAFQSRSLAPQCFPQAQSAGRQRTRAWRSDCGPQTGSRPACTEAKEKPDTSHAYEVRTRWSSAFERILSRPAAAARPKKESSALARGLLLRKQRRQTDGDRRGGNQPQKADDKRTERGFFFFPSSSFAPLYIPSATQANPRFRREGAQTRGLRPALASSSSLLGGARGSAKMGEKRLFSEKRRRGKADIEKTAASASPPALLLSGSLSGRPRARAPELRNSAVRALEANGGRRSVLLSPTRAAAATEGAHAGRNYAPSLRDLTWYTMCPPLTWKRSLWVLGSRVHHGSEGQRRLARHGSLWQRHQSTIRPHHSTPVFPKAPCRLPQLSPTSKASISKLSARTRARYDAGIATHPCTTTPHHFVPPLPFFSSGATSFIYTPLGGKSVRRGILAFAEDHPKYGPHAQAQWPSSAP